MKEDIQTRLSEMMVAYDKALAKSREAPTVWPRDSIVNAAMTMREQRADALLVVEDERLCGLINEADIAAGYRARDVNTRRTGVARLMRGQVAYCHEDDAVEEVRRLMAARHLRRLPVLSHRASPRVVGVVSIEDLPLT